LTEQQSRSEELAKQLEREQNQRNELERELAKLKEQRSGSETNTGTSIISFALMPGLLRGEDNTAKIELKQGAEQLRLSLELEPEQEGYKKYSAELRSEEDKGIWNGENLKAQQSKAGKAVAVKLSTK